jgi:hypothetical protein
MDGVKKKLKITRWDVEGKAVTGKAFEVMLNPALYTRNSTLDYSKQDAKLVGARPEALSFDELVFDGTGVVGVQSGMPMSVDKQIEMLHALLFDAVKQDDVARPVVQIIWGSLYFLGRLKSMKVRYTLFKPSGSPLRARVSLSFTEYEQPYKNEALDSSAADTLTRQIEVSASTSLPLLCFATYRDPAMAQAVARSNNLTSFRNVPSGTKLNCPPRDS